MDNSNHRNYRGSQSEWLLHLIKDPLKANISMTSNRIWTDTKKNTSDSFHYSSSLTIILFMDDYTAKMCVNFVDLKMDGTEDPLFSSFCIRATTNYSLSLDTILATEFVKKNWLVRNDTKGVLWKESIQSVIRYFKKLPCYWWSYRSKWLRSFQLRYCSKGQLFRVNLHFIKGNLTS